MKLFYIVMDGAVKLLGGVFLVSVLGVSSVTPVSAEIYKWRDSNGVMHFSDHPPAEAEHETVNITPASVVKSSDVEKNDSAPTTPKDKVDKPHVVMYATSWCPYCAQARKYFKENSIAYTEYDVEKLPRRMREFKKLGGTGYPLILIGQNEKMQGFSVAGFERRYYK
ncbi:hypothetical protein GCM10011352_23790 [Marinobacterium zhoushanense]|uniref:Glutaredoxin n=1 Tax=Marinobacterium zhoushanense TaxID=1679163 RepID=A0ABQ1KHZ0_9GAMM|nr:DUF4124 domain-containing protein [Marinobacterium zhoushanense]GGB96885.1 hypothetical protein GCM10011352_23790 [Marinobacterium zhoushanense]